MRLSLDTHTFLWLLSEPARLAPEAREAIVDAANEVFVSVVVAWEMVIKLALGRLRLTPASAAWLPAELKRRGLEPLAVELPHVLLLERLPPHHRDPFDRLLIAQAQVEGLILVTHDRAFAAYDAPVLWT
ncbi:MAG: type II toxin-antitoxin system VapC family toxin [Chloroflexota bacterium]